MIKERSNKVDNSIPNGWIVPIGWKLEKFKDITDILKCGIASTPTYVEKGVPFLSSQNVKENRINLEKYNYISEEYHEFLTKNNKPKKGDILYTRVGANFGLAAVSNLDFEYSVYVSLTHIRMKEGYNSTFYSYMLNSDRYRNLARRSVFQGGGVPNLNVKIVENFNMLIPPLKEQEKIAEILSSWDLAIEKQEQLIEKKKEFKKGLMQRLLSGEVRFKEFNDKWKIVSLGSIFNRVTDKNNVGATNVLTISAQNGLVNQEDYFNKSVSSKDLSGYYLLKKGDFAYNKSYSNGYPLGAIKRLNNYDEGVVSPLYICFRAKEKMSTCFYEQYFESGFLNKEIFKIAQEGARNHGLLNVSVTEFFKDIKIAKPSLEEQNKIAEVLIQADKEIELIEKELEALKLQKKGLMERLLTGEVRVKV